MMGRILNRKSRVGRNHKNVVAGEMGVRLRLISVISLITIVICACGGSGGDKSAYLEAAPSAVAEEAAYDTSASYDSGAGYVEEAYEYETAEAATEEPASEGGYEEGMQTAAAGRKLIKTVNISAETEEFDTLVPELQRQVEALGGYIESISVYDVDSYYVEEHLEKQRCASLTARVPKEKLDGFLSRVGEQTNVTSRSENVEDVTLQYVDLESHKKVLLTEQERLLTLLGQAESVEDIIAIEGRLSEVRYQLESMESQLRTYDNQIDYSTVYLSIVEVRKYSAPQDASAWQRIERGFAKSLENIGFGIRDFAIGFVIYLPYIFFWMVLIAVAWILGRILWKTRKKRVEKREAQRADAAEKTHRYLFQGEKTAPAENPGMDAPEPDQDMKQESGGETEE